MNDNRNMRPTALEDHIRRQFGTSGTTRFLHSMPAFHVDAALPEPFEQLLRELDHVERACSTSQNRRA